MPHEVTTDFSKQQAKLESDLFAECYIIDLASVYDYVSFEASSKKIYSRNRNGSFPTTRIKVGDTLEITGTVSNNQTVTVVAITDKVLTVSESIVDESVVLARFTNYDYYIRYLHDVYFFKMQGDSFINSSQLYTAGNINRENIQNSLDNSYVVRINIQNVDRVMEGIIQTRRYLRGCNIFITNAFKDEFPSGSTYQYLGTNPNYLAHLLEKYTIDGVNSDYAFVRFECRPKFYFKNIKVPRRILSSTYCDWADEYGGINCDPDGTNIDYTLYPTCDGTIEQCRERGNIKRIGIFPGVPKGSVYF